MKKILPVILVLAAAGALVWVMSSTMPGDGAGFDSVPAPPPPEPDPEPRPGPAPAPRDPDPADAPATTGKGSLEGRVLRADDGAPIPGADVLVWRRGWKKEVRTDAAGHFSVPSVPAGGVRVRVRTGEYVDPPTRSVPIVDGQAATILFELETGVVLTGHVTDGETGGVIRDAEVSLAGSDRKKAVSGPGGEYRLTGLGSGRATLTASAREYPASRFSLEVPEGEREVRKDLELQMGATVRGIVTESGGAGIPGAKVSLRGFPPSSVETDEAGAFELPAVPVGRAVWITAEKDDYVPTRSDELRFKRGEAFDGLALVLTRGATVRGTVLDPEGGPVEGATVWLVPRDPRRFAGRPPRAKSGADGAFELSPVAAGDHQLVVNRQGALAARLEVNAVPEGGLVDGVTVRLDSGGRISGIVRDGEGKPMNGVVVMARPVEAGTGARWGNDRTDKEGRFDLNGLVPGSYEVTARPPRGGRSSDPVTVSVGAEDVELRLPVPGTISGVVVDASGRPATSFTVRARATDPGGPGGMVFDRVNSKDGSFRLQNVAPGTYTVEVSSNDGFSEPLPGISVGAGSEVTGLRIELLSPGSIRGRVFGSDGSPAAGARVAASGRARGLGASGGSDRADERGEYHLTNLRPGTYRVTASDDGLVASSDEIEITAGGEARADLRFPPTGSLVVKAVSESGRPVPGASVQLRTAEGSWIPIRVPEIDESIPPDRRAAERREAMQASVRTDASGTCVRQAVPAGEILVRVVAAGYEDGEATAVVTAGSSREVRVVLRPGVSSMDRKRDRLGGRDR